MSVSTKAVVCVAEMARMVGLSRARFYQLVGSAFPHPVYDLSTRRPHYVEEMQTLCLEVRRRNCGVDGRPILFYPRRSATVAAPKRKSSTLKVSVNTDLIDALKGLGLAATVKQIEAAVKDLFPGGTHGVDQGEIVRTVFIHLNSKGA